MSKASQNHGISATIAKIIQEMYTDLKAKIITDTEGQNFDIRRWVRQGDALSPLLFNRVLNEILKNWNNEGININGEFLSNLRFAVDVAIVAGRWDDLQTMLEELNWQSRVAGMQINKTKTKVLIIQALGNQS